MSSPTVHSTPNGKGAAAYSDFSDDEEVEVEHPGDYSSRMEELLDDEDDEDIHVNDGHGEEEEEEEEEVFVYSGVDAEAPANYRDQLRDVLGPEDTGSETDDIHEVDKSSVLPSTSDIINFEDTMPNDVLSDHTPSSSSIALMTPPRVDSPFSGAGTPSRRPFMHLHPTVSRLRSYTPQLLPNTGLSASQSAGFSFASPSASHFSAMSRMSSMSNLHAALSNDQPSTPGGEHKQMERDVFKWTQLSNISQQIYMSRPSKASNILGASSMGSPTVLAANGLICVGTTEGNVWVFDFKQTLKCICGADALANTPGPVTALALSHDHTYVASGHTTGYIQLYDLKNPKTPARSVPPTTLTAVGTGRKEGHIHGSRIVNVGFIAGRHTAIVSADENGLSFYHSLGKVLFVEASDTLRILGKYQLESQSSFPLTPTTPTPSNGNSSPKTPNMLTYRSRHRKSRYSVLSMAPLPLGTVSHPTDAYNIVALLTPTKLVIVSLKPVPRTWFKCTREADENGESRARSRSKGTISWFPTVMTSPIGENIPKEDSKPTNPLLLYTWGPSMNIVHVFETRSKQMVKNPRTGKESEIEIGVIEYERVCKWAAEDDILAAQWLNVNQAVVITASSLHVYDIRLRKTVEEVQYDGLALLSPRLSYTINGSVSYSDAVGDISHSFRVYKGKMFVLGREQLQAGTLLTWADRILSFVQDGDFLSAIDITRTYYCGDFVGNSNGLPDNLQERKEIVGEKMRDLMVASSRYAFSEDRMTDGTHDSVDGRGVDRTSLFEGLVSTCCRACIALDDFEFLFEDLFQVYDDNGIARLYLLQLEQFILTGKIDYVPPRITQRLIAIHDGDQRPDLVERVVWHIDPACLDINQTITICQEHHLYDALIYIYTRALRDYVAPVVKLLGLIRKVRQFRRYRLESEDEWTEDDDATIEPWVLNAYKVYPYLANVLSGLTYPSEQTLLTEEAFEAKKSVYSFLFFGRSSTWPPGEGGELILTADEDGGLEPTYPYARLLLQFDAESFLHSLDIAFEDAYLNDESQGVSRLVIVTILLEILSSGSLSSSDATFVNIFVARNVPKYPQFLDHIPPTALHNILIGLAKDSDPSTREDRQLATEYLLSVYTPHENDRIVDLFRGAGFFRILRDWHRQEGRWSPLLKTYLEDPDLRPFEVFDNAKEVLNLSKQVNKDTLPPELIATISDALPRLLLLGTTSTAVLLDEYAPELHEKAMEVLGENADHQRFMYLQHLLGPPRPTEDEYWTIRRNPEPSTSISKVLRQRFISLQCRFHPKDVISVFNYLPSDYLDWEQVIAACESHDIYDATIWAYNHRDGAVQALTKAESFEKKLTQEIVESSSADVIFKCTSGLEALGEIGISICLESSHSSYPEVPLEDIWFQLLSSQIDCIQNISMASTSQDNDVFDKSLSSLRALVQKTFSALVTMSSTHAISFPRLFKRLVNSPRSAVASTGTQYTEFRTILTGMLESYRSEGDMLIISKHLVDRDYFETLEEFTQARARGWAPSRGICTVCRQPLTDMKNGGDDDESSSKIVVSRTGDIYHERCPSV